MFDATMQNVEDASPYDYTLHFSYSNGSNTYMPDLRTWEFGSYETDTAIFVEGSAEIVEQTFIDMLNQMYNE